MSDDELAKHFKSRLKNGVSGGGFFAGDSVSFFKGRKYAELFVDRLMTSKRKKPFTTVFKYRLLVKGIINEFVNEKYDKKSRLKN